MRRIRLGLLTLGSTLVFLAVSVSVAVAGKPVITGLAAGPNPVASGGTVTVSASVSEATECAISANKAVVGLPVSFSCESGSVSRELTMPANGGEKAVKYALKLTAKGAGGVAKQSVSVSVNHAEPPPLFMEAGYDFEDVLGACGTENVSPVLISGDGTSAVWGNCTYMLQDETWVQAASLPKGGKPLAMSRDGLTLVMAYELTHIEIFARSSESEEWAPQATLTEAAKYVFLPQVSISADGDRLLLGAAKESGLPERPPREFDRSGETWSEGEAPHVAQGLACGRVVLSNDGDTALLSCNEVQNNKLVGTTVLPFVRSGSTWMQQGPPLKGSGQTPKDEFGGKMALSASGDTALIGGAYNLKKKGEVWVFQRNGETWSQQGSPLAQPEKKKYAKLLGAAVALSADGNLALAGAPGVEDDEKPSKGLSAVYVYERTGESWSFREKLGEHQGEFSDEFGLRLALSESGTTALIPRRVASGKTYSRLDIFSQ